MPDPSDTKMLTESHVGEGLRRLREAADTQHTAVLSWRQARAVLDDRERWVADQQTAAIEVERLTDRLDEASRAGLTWKRRAEDAEEAIGRARELADRWDATAASPHAPVALSAGVLRRAIGDPDGPDDPPPALHEPRPEPPLNCEQLCCPAPRPHDVGAPGCEARP